MGNVDKEPLLPTQKGHKRLFKRDPTDTRSNITQFVGLILAVILFAQTLLPKEARLWNWALAPFSSHCSRYSEMHTMAPAPKGPIDWEVCGKGFECGRLEVPLDYHDESLGKASLSVGRYLATNKDRIGSLFVNPGGPGGSGVSFVFRAGPQLSAIVEGKYDIVSWDPRGINKTTPRVECFANKRDQDLYGLEHDTRVQIGNLSSSEGIDDLRRQLQAAYSEDALLAELCDEHSGDTLSHVGTATVVRDLEYFSSVLEGPETPVNFAGFSYGTVVGAYFVNMFPHRVGRVIIDGVAEPVSWAGEPSYAWPPRDFQDAEKAYENFLVSCVTAGPERCALALNDTTALALDRKIRGTIHDLYDYPLAVPHAERPGILTSDHVRSAIFSAMYKPRGWPSLAENIASLLAGDGAPFLNDANAGLNLSDTTSPQTTSAAINAVQCVDGPELFGKFTPDEAVEEALKWTLRTWDTSTTLFTSLGIDLQCFTWKKRETERFTGPFNTTGLANEILVIGNTADPICPLASAREVNARLPDSRLLIQDGAGHCSLAQASLCTGKVLREYFLEGKLPENGKVCPVTELLFPPKPPAPNATLSSSTSTSQELSSSLWKSDKGQLTADDLDLLENLRAFGEAAFEADVRRPRGRRF